MSEGSATERAVFAHPRTARHGTRHTHVTLAGPLASSGELLLKEHLRGAPLAESQGTLVWQLALDLQSRGQLVSAVTLDRKASGIVTLPTSPLITCGPFRRRHRMRDLMRVERHAVRHAVLGLQPTLVHAHWCYEYALGALSSGIPTLVTIHDWIPAVLRHTDWHVLHYYSGRALLYGATLVRARHFTAVSPYSADRVRRLTGKAVEVVPNGVPDSMFDDGSTSLGRTAPEAASAYFFSANRGFGPLKNVHTLLTAFSVVRRRFPRCNLALAGDEYAPGGAAYLWARKRGLHQGVQFLGPLPRSRVLNLMKGVVALVHPSREENMPMTLVEAMAQRTPVVGGKCSGGVPWVLADGKAGLLVDVNDPRAVASAMVTLLTDSALQRRLGEQGFMHAQAEFRQSRVTDMYIETYKRVLAEERVAWGSH